MSLDVYLIDVRPTTVYEANITHNLAAMADAAGLYSPIWRPNEFGDKTAADLIEPLRTGLAKLEADPERFRELNPSNGWGSYDGLVRFVRNYLAACEENPNATIRAHR